MAASAGYQPVNRAYPDPHELAISTLHMNLSEGLKVVRPRIEDESIYGAVLTIPQIARSTHWSSTVTIMTIRILALFLLNCFLQGLLLYMVNKEENVVDKYAGQMFLCDFGTSCSGESCVGPMGTNITPDRLYSWGDLAIRLYVRDSFLALFPEKADDISAKVDPGEYGVNDNWCRLACVFIFTLSIMEEFLNVLRMMYLLHALPTQADHWIFYSDESRDEHELEVKAGGMPLAWKLFNGVFVLLPKAVIFHATASTGTSFLMESPGISEVIVNAVALVFVLSIPQVIFTELTLRVEKNLLSGMTQFHPKPPKTHSQAELVESHLIRSWHVKDVLNVLNVRLVVACGLFIFYVYFYYVEHCVLTEDKHWVSKPQYLPKTEAYSILNALLPSFFPVESKENAYWSPPEKL